MDIAKNAQQVREKIALACKKSNRNFKDVLLIAVSKNRSEKEIREAYAAGIRDFGENRVQEALEKRDAYPSDCTLHFIGRLQSNKARQAVSFFNAIHSVDSLALAQKISKHAQTLGKTQNILLQVNVSGEKTKSGLAPSQAQEVVQEILKLEHIKLSGLMTIAPITQTKEDSRPHFEKLRKLRDELEKNTHARLPQLSMGMTDDFEAAVEEGATMVRVGRAIFG